MTDIASYWPKALSYDAFLDRHANPNQLQRWRTFEKAVTLTAEQQKSLAGYTRQMNILCLSGAWCGDCVEQVPILKKFAEATPKIDLRLLDRDAYPELTAQLQVNGGQRVPVVVFFSEDNFEVARFGDKTLARFRRAAQALMGDSCPTGAILPPAEQIAAEIADWLREVERVQLLLRLSGRLRQLHND